MSESALALPSQCRSGINCFACTLSSSCPWDLNCDGVVDGADLGQLQLHYDNEAPCGPECTGIDYTGGGGSFAGGGSAPMGAGEGQDSIPNLSAIIAELTESGHADLVVWLLQVLGDSDE